MDKILRIALFAVVGCAGFVGALGCGSDGSCDLPANFSTANSGGLCQVNFFGETGEDDHAVFCGETAEGDFDCACGPAADNPREFTSPDFCDLDPEARACAAIEACDFPL